MLSGNVFSMSAIEALSLIKSHLYVPADNPAMLAKAASRGADALILDLEDAVASSRKLLARESAREFAATAAGSGPEVWVRVNDGDLGLEDLDAVAGAPGVDGVWLPKAEPGAWLDAALARAERAGVRVGLLIESAFGLSRLRDYPELPASSLVQVGEADLAASLRIDGREDQLLVYRSLVVLEWAARGLSAPIAPVSVTVDDPEGYRAQCELMRAWGFVGRACVHPVQVEQANATWSVSDADIHRAREVVREFERHESEGAGAYRGADGTMVDRATVRWARALLARSNP